MAERIHPHPHNDEEEHTTLKPPPPLMETPTSPTPLIEKPPLPPRKENPTSPAPLMQKPASPAPGTYVINIPKDQIYRVPPPENADRYKHLSRRRKPASCCSRFIYCLCTISLLTTLLLAIAAAIFYFIVRPESPNYSINTVSIKSLNLTSPSSPISPQFNITVTANNPNNKIGIYYVEGSSVNVHFKDVNLCSGVLPQFFQSSNNVTVFTTALKGSGIKLTSSVYNDLDAARKSKAVPFKVDIRAPVKMKVGSVKTWVITVKVKCDVTVDSLTAASKIVSKKCNYGVDLW